VGGSVIAMAQLYLSADVPPTLLYWPKPIPDKDLRKLSEHPLIQLSHVLN
jgi:hypothetical protein